MLRLRVLIVFAVCLIIRPSVYAQTDEEIETYFNQVNSFIIEFNDSVLSMLHRKDYTGAIEMCHMVDSMFKSVKLDESFFYAYVLGDMTIAYNSIGDSSKVYTYGKHALQVFENSNTIVADNWVSSYITILDCVANSCIKLGKDVEAARYRHSCISPWQYNHVIQRS